MRLTKINSEFYVPCNLNTEMFNNDFDNFLTQSSIIRSSLSALATQQSEIERAALTKICEISKQD